MNRAVTLKRALGFSFLVLAMTLTASFMKQPEVVSANIFQGWRINGAGTISEGYFSNNGLSDMNPANRSNCRGAGQSGLCPVLPNSNYATNAINRGYYVSTTRSSEAKARELAAELQRIYSNGSPHVSGPISSGNHRAWSRAGAAFIVNTMLGYNLDNPSKTRTITAAMWTDLENRLVDRANRGLINWNTNFDARDPNTGVARNTYVRIIRNADGVNRHDVVYDSSNNFRNGIVILNNDRSVAYRMWYICANPVGAMGGVPSAPTYDHTPSLSVSPGFSEAGESVTVESSMSNSGNAASPSTTEWRVVRFVLRPGQTPPGVQTNGTFPTTHYGGEAPGARTIGEGTRSFPRGSLQFDTRNSTILDRPVDWQICFGLSVRNVTQASSNWRHSAARCVTVAKAPKFQAKGGDIFAGRSGTGNIITSTKRLVTNNRTYGSWGEYAVSATGIVEGMASASGYSGGRVISSVCDVAYLTISNAGGASCTQTTVLGGYAGVAVPPSITARFDDPRPNAPSSVDLATTPSGTIYGGAGTITVRATSDIGLVDEGGEQVGRWVVINAPEADVIIRNDIVYTNQVLRTVSQIPQVIIIANNIFIEPGVGQIDAWLIASGESGRIVTCQNGTIRNFNQVRSTNCNTQLTINGPVAARTIELRRTFGSEEGPRSGDPAEIINLRPDAYLWATNYNVDSGRVPTVSTRELPPRF